jgi:hypothetical protein
MAPRDLLELLFGFRETVSRRIYEIVHAPHLAGAMQSLRGEFRLVPLAGGRTRLEGTTWYRLKMSPNAYWSFYSERVIEVIHHRVLEHVRRLSEQVR